MKNQTQVGEEITTSPDGTQRPETEERRRPLNVPRSWKEVASIDFTGYVDRDCDERVIYKTPEGKFKAVRHDVGYDQPNVDEVSREKVASWIHQCFIPKEFEADFTVSALPKTEEERVSREEKFKAGTDLDNAVHHIAGLNEALAVLVTLAAAENDEFLMSKQGLDGLTGLALGTSDELRDAFDHFYKAAFCSIKEGQ